MTLEHIENLLKDVNLLTEKYLDYCQKHYAEYKPLRYTVDQLKVDFCVKKIALPNEKKPSIKVECVICLEGKVVLRTWFPEKIIREGIRPNTIIDSEYDQVLWWVNPVYDGLEKIISGP